MDTPSLWTQIYSLNPDCVQAFLLRSKKMPLDVKYLLDIDLAAPVLFFESHRFRHVELSSSRAARAFFTHPFPRGAPLLSHLKLSYSSDLRTDSPVCQRGLPALRHLDLRSLPMIDVPLPSGLFNPSLRCLVITKPSQRRSPSAWARILAEFPLLEELTLSFILPRPSSEYLPQVEPESTSPIRLPHLSSLNIIGDNIAIQSTNSRYCNVSSPRTTSAYISFHTPPSNYIAVFHSIATSTSWMFCAISSYQRSMWRRVSTPHTSLYELPWSWPRPLSVTCPSISPSLPMMIFASTVQNPSSTCHRLPSYFSISLV